MLIWLVGGLNPDEIKEHLSNSTDTAFKDTLLVFLDDTIATSIPEDPLPEEEILSSMYHPSSV